MNEGKKTEFNAQISRLQELFSEIKKERESNITDQNINPKLRAVTQEFFVKCSIILDQLFYYICESKRKNLENKIYFPIFDSKKRFDEVMLKYGFDKDKADDQKVISFLEVLQPYSSKLNKWIELVKLHGSQKKHLELIVMTRRDKLRGLEVSNKGAHDLKIQSGGEIILGDESKFIFGGKVVMGKRIREAKGKLNMTRDGVFFRKTLWTTIEIHDREKNVNEDILQICVTCIFEIKKILENTNSIV